MIELYSWPTPNGHKIHIMLEETELPYEVHAVDIGEGEQFDPKFLEISPNNKIPAIIDKKGPDGKPIHLFESGAILIYLAEKSGKFLPKNKRKYYRTLEWLIFQVASMGPMFGQANHFRKYAPETIEYAINRYTKEANRLIRVLDHRLSENQFLAGDEYTIADIAVWPWTRKLENQGVNSDDYPHFKRWFSEIEKRPAVQRGIKVLSDVKKDLKSSKTAFENLFGDKQYQKHDIEK